MRADADVKIVIVMYIVYLYSIVYIYRNIQNCTCTYIMHFFNTCFVCCFAKLRFEGIPSCWCRARCLSSCSARIYTRPELKASAYLAGSLSRVSMFQVSELLRTSWKQRGYLARTRPASKRKAHLRPCHLHCTKVCPKGRSTFPLGVLLKCDQIYIHHTFITFYGCFF
jgi:hypothetical protein